MHASLRTVVEDALTRLGSAIGRDLSLGADGVVGLEFAEGLGCTIEVPEGAGHVYFSASVMVMPQAGRAALLARLMAKNLFAVSLPSAWLALDDAADEIVFCATIPAADVDPERFAGLLMAFTEAVRDLRRELGETVPDGHGDAGFHSSDMMIRG